MQKIAESEELGAQTAAELHRQREALERTKERLNESEATLRESESKYLVVKWGASYRWSFGPNNVPFPRSLRSTFFKVI